MTDEPGARRRSWSPRATWRSAVGRLDLAALASNYLGIARVELGDPDGLQLLRESVDAAIDAHQYEYAARGYCNLAELLARGGRLDELEAACATGCVSPASAGSGRTPTTSSCTAASA